jgi:hypothetical protein
MLSIIHASRKNTMATQPYHAPSYIRTNNFTHTSVRMAILHVGTGTRGYRTRMAGYIYIYFYSYTVPAWAGYTYTFIPMDNTYTLSVKSWKGHGYSLVPMGIPISYLFILTCGYVKLSSIVNLACHSCTIVD